MTAETPLPTRKSLTWQHPFRNDLTIVAIPEEGRLYYFDSYYRAKHFADLVEAGWAPTGAAASARHAPLL